MLPFGDVKTVEANHCIVFQLRNDLAFTVESIRKIHIVDEFPLQNLEGKGFPRFLVEHLIGLRQQSTIEVTDDAEMIHPRVDVEDSHRINPISIDCAAP